MNKIYEKFQHMKGLARITMLILTIAGITLLASCGDDEKPKNQFKVNGKTYSLSHGYTDAILNITASGSAHYIVLAGKNLEIDSDGSMSGEDHFFIMEIGSTDGDELASDTYDIAIEAYEFGNVPWMFAAENFRLESDGDGGFDGVGDQEFYPYEGTVKVSKSGSKFTFTVKATEFDYYDQNGNDHEGSGGVRAYFNGSLETVMLYEDEGGERVPAKVRQIFENLHKKGSGFVKK